HHGTCQTDDLDLVYTNIWGWLGQGRSLLLSLFAIVRSVGHHDAALLKQIAAPICSFGLVADGMRKRCLCNGAWVMGPSDTCSLLTFMRDAAMVHRPHSKSIPSTWLPVPRLIWRR